MYNFLKKFVFFGVVLSCSQSLHSEGYDFNSKTTEEIKNDLEGLCGSILTSYEKIFEACRGNYHLQSFLNNFFISIKNLFLDKKDVLEDIILKDPSLISACFGVIKTIEDLEFFAKGFIKIFTVFSLPNEKDFSSPEAWMSEREVFEKFGGKEAGDIYKKVLKSFLQVFKVIIVEASDVSLVVKRFNELKEVFRVVGQKRSSTSLNAKFFELIGSYNLKTIEITPESLENLNAMYAKFANHRGDLYAFLKAFLKLSCNNVRLPVHDFALAKSMVEDFVVIAKDLLPELEALIKRWNKE